MRLTMDLLGRDPGGVIALAGPAFAELTRQGVVSLAGPLRADSCGG
jgi:hypothetical protein